MIYQGLRKAGMRLMGEMSVFFLTGRREKGMDSNKEGEESKEIGEK